MMRILALFLLAALLPGARAKINVVATLPDFGSIAEMIGGDEVAVTSIARGTEDAHFVDARPSFVRVLNKADLLIETGAELELGWLPPLLQSARNPKIQGTGPGHLALAPYIALIDRPTQPVDRSMGDVHAAGNPHFWLDPENGLIIAEKIAAALAALEPGQAPVFQKNLENFRATLAARMILWQKQLAPFRETKVITYHKSYDYFARRFGLRIVGQIEPKPGIEPSATHINAIAQLAKREGVKLILIEPFRPRRSPAQIASAIGATVLPLADKVGAQPETGDYFSLFDHNARQLAQALAAAP